MRASRTSLQTHAGGQAMADSRAGSLFRLPSIAHLSLECPNHAKLLGEHSSPYALFLGKNTS